MDPLPGEVSGVTVTMTLEGRAPAGMATCSVPSAEARLPPVMPICAEVVFPVGASGDVPPQPAAKNNNIAGTRKCSLLITIRIGRAPDRLKSDPCLTQTGGGAE